MSQTAASREEAVAALWRHGHDIVATIFELSGARPGDS